MRFETSFDLNGDGLLGMSFLLDYNIEIREAERRIIRETLVKRVDFAPTARDEV